VWSSTAIRFVFFVFHPNAYNLAVAIRCNIPVFTGVFWEIKCFNQKWLHHHQLESYSKEEEKIGTYMTDQQMVVGCSSPTNGCRL
jgi:hypothetical protein